MLKDQTMMRHQFKYKMKVKLKTLIGLDFRMRNTLFNQFKHLNTMLLFTNHVLLTFIYRFTIFKQKVKC